MKNKLNRVLLIDDDEDCNYYHVRLLKKVECAEEIKVVTNGKEGLDYLTTKINGHFPNPALIFLDLNMPVMNGWDFIKEYSALPEEIKSSSVLIILTTSLNPDDKSKSLEYVSVKDFQIKYLSGDSLNELLKVHFPANF